MYVLIAPAALNFFHLQLHACKVDVCNSFLFLNGHLYLSDVMLSVNLRTDTKKTCVEKRLDNMLKFFLTILDVIDNITRQTYMTI